MAKFKKGEKRPPNAGRKKGTPNKATATFRDALSQHEFDVVMATIELYREIDTPPDIRFKCLYLLAEYSYYKPKNPLELPGAIPERPDTPETELSDDDITKALDGKKAN